MTRTLVITNDFPPRRGGIETFVHAMTSRFPMRLRRRVHLRRAGVRRP